MISGVGRRPDREWVVTWLVVVGCAAVLVVAVTAGEAPAADAWPYVAVFGLVLGDAVLAFLPGETTLNVAATMAATGTLDLGWVVAAGAAGAVVGDSTLYAIARRMRTRVSRQLEAALAHDKIAAARELIGTSAPSLLVLGRYVPGMRFVVNASLGLAEHPYPQFLRWSAVGGTVWSIYCCSVAYLVGTVLSAYPIASVAVSALASSVAFAVVLFVIVRRARELRARQAV